MEDKVKQMVVKGMVMIRVVYVCVMGVFLINIANPVFEWFALRKQRDAQYQAQEETQEMLREQRRILEETLKVFAEISKERASAIPANPPNSVVGMESDSVQEMASVNPDALDSVPCCGDPTDLPPVLKMVNDPVPDDSEGTDNPPQTFEEAYEYELEQQFAGMPEEMRSQMRGIIREVNAFEASLGEEGLAELENMKDGLREQFLAQESLFMPAGVEIEDLPEEYQEEREFAREKIIHFRALSHLMLRKQNAAIDKRIQASRQYIKEVDEILLTPEERAKREVIKAATDLAFPPNEE